MKFNDSMKFAMMNRAATLHSMGITLEFLFSFWNGPAPTLSQFNTAFEANSLTDYSDSNPGRITAASTYTWIRDTLGSTELCVEDYTYEGHQILTPIEVVYDPISVTTEPANYPMTILAEGQAQFFSAMICNSNTSEANRYNTGIQSEVYYLLLGTLGTVGSGADLEIAETNITFDSTVQPGTIRFTF